MALARVAALALAWWLAASTTLYVLARMTRVPSLVGAVEWATLPAVRRLGLAVTTMAAGSVLATSGVAAAAPADDTAVVVQLGTDGTSATTAPRYRPRPAGSDDTVGTAPVAAVTTAPPARTAMPSAVAAGGDDSSPTAGPRRAPPEEAAGYVVQPGDNLWRIAERHVATLTGQPATDLAIAEVRSYWVRLVDHNRGRLRSGDPDLIYPGEQLTLPPSV